MFVCENFKVFKAKMWMPKFSLIRIQNCNCSLFVLDVIQSYKDKHNENRSILQCFEAYMVWRGLNYFVDQLCILATNANQRNFSQCICRQLLLRGCESTSYIYFLRLL